MAKRRKAKIAPKTEGGPPKEAGALPPVATEKTRLASAIAIGYFVLLFGFISISSFLEKSLTIDEPAHLFAGYSHLEWGDFRANPEHPPLAKIWAALPLLAFKIRDPRPGRPHWDSILQDDGFTGVQTVNVARDMFFVDNDGATLFFYAKLQMIFLGIVLGIFVYLWTKELFGLPAAAVALFVYALDPNILAHSQIVHTDIAFAAGFFIATYFFWRALRRLSWASLFGAVCAFGLVAATKYSYLAILVAWTILGSMSVFSSVPQECRIGARRAVSNRSGKAALLVLLLVCALAAAYFSIWAAYRFRFDAAAGAGPLPTAQLMPASPGVRAVTSFALEHHLFPEAWIVGQLYTLKNLKRPAYLLEETSADGFWAYFPVAFAVKTPLPTLILFFSGVLGWWVWDRRRRAVVLFLLVPPAVYFSFAVWARMNIGLRHILPVYPFLFVLLGGAAVELWRTGAWVKKALVVLAVWYVVSSLSVYPHYLAYFNELAGGPANGHAVLVDSNLDWGQDLKGLKRWMDGHGVKRIKLLYFGLAYPEYYGIDAVYLPGSWGGYDAPSDPSAQAPGYLAVSASLLYATDIFYKGDQKEFAEKEFIRAFRTREPVAIIGHSIHVFRLS